MHAVYSPCRTHSVQASTGKKSLNKFTAWPHCVYTCKGRQTALVWAGLGKNDMLGLLRTMLELYMGVGMAYNSYTVYSSYTWDSRKQLPSDV